MIKTIEISPYISVQGLLVGTHPGGEVEVSLNGRHYIGRPVVGAMAKELAGESAANADPQEV